MGQPLRCRGIFVLSLVLACTGGEMAGSGATTSTTSTTPTSTTSTATSTATSTSSTSAAATDDSVGESSTTEPGCTFLGCEDMPNTNCGSETGTGYVGRCLECDPFVQDCPRGQKCTTFSADGQSWNSTVCKPLARNPAAPGEPCSTVAPLSGVDNCDIGSMCWDVDDQTGVGVCVPLCAGDYDSPICPEGLTCAQANGGSLLLCLSPCDPFLQDCSAGDTCVPAPGGAVCVPDASGAAGVAGDPCEWLNTCDPGLVCLDADEVEGCAGDPGCCAPLCDLDAPAPCPGPGESCVPWYAPGEAPPGLEHIGVCALP